MDHLAIASIALGSIIVILSNVPILTSLILQSRSKNLQTSTYYCDEDGEATKSTVSALGNKWTWVSIPIFSLIGLVCASAIATIAVIRRAEKLPMILIWSQLGSWVGSSHDNPPLASFNRDRGYHYSNPLHSLQRSQPLRDSRLPTVHSGLALA